MNEDKRVIEGKTYLSEKGYVNEAFQLMENIIDSPLLAHLQTIGASKEIKSNLDDVLLLMSVKSRMHNKGDEYSLALQDFAGIIAGLGSLVEKDLPRDE